MAASDFGRVLVEVLEIDLDRCTLTYGMSPCTASGGSGNECYNTFQTCQDKANYNRGSVTYVFCNRGAPLPSGETCRPLVSSIRVAPTELPELAGLARRNSTTITLSDAPDADVDQDPYKANRASPASGTFWSRLLARNHNYAGRTARIKRGYFLPDSNGRVTYDLSAVEFTTEKFIIESIRRSASGEVQFIVKDPLKLADRIKIPTPTDGKLLYELKAVEHAGVAQSGSTSTTIVLASDASAADDYYNGFEVYITENTGAGQRRVITDYVGATRTATVSTWSVTPDTTSVYKVGALKLTLDSGSGSQYRNPSTTGKREFVRIGEEIIEYTGLSGDVLSWPDTTYRNAFSETTDTLKDHKVNDNVQQCLAWINTASDDIIEELHNEAGIADSLMDLTGLAAECATWLRSDYNITVCLSDPDDGSKVIDDLLQDFLMLEWWDPVSQKIKFKVNAPAVSSSYDTLDQSGNLLRDSVSVQPLDEKRITRAGLYFHLESATANRAEAKSYLRGSIYVDTDAESADEYGDNRPQVRYSRWLRDDNSVAAAARVARTISWLRNAPKRIQFKIDPKDSSKVAVGTLFAVDTDRIPDYDGTSKQTIVRSIKVMDEGRDLTVDGMVTSYSKRYAFIGPAGLPNYTSATDAQRSYAFVCNASGKMSNGDEGYLII